MDTPPSSPVNTENTVHETKDSDMWSEIGLHKPMAGFWYRIVFLILSLLLGIIFTQIIFTYFYPFPETMGYKNNIWNFFALFITIFNLGTWGTLERFVPEMRIRDPKRMIKYIQWYVWYQSITGLIQVSIIAVMAFWWAPTSDLSYAIWVMLIFSLSEFPGNIAVFRILLNSFQFYHKVESLNFFYNDINGRIFEVVFVLLGRWYGLTHPEIGELMGIVIGSALNLILRDIPIFFISASIFGKAMKSEGIRIRDCFRHEFDWPLVKECSVFGIKTGMTSVVAFASALIMLWEWLVFVPQYVSLATLAGIAVGLASLLNQAQYDITPLISEAYLNDKRKLTQYYITQMWRFGFQIHGFMLGMLLIVYSVLPEAFVALGMNNYSLAIAFMIPSLIATLPNPYIQIADSILFGTNHPNFLLGMRIIEEILKVLFTTMFIVWLSLPQRFGLPVIYWIMPCGVLLPVLIRMGLNFWYINKYIVKVEISWWQTVVAPLIATIILIGCGVIFKLLVFDPLFVHFGIYVGVIAAMIYLVALLELVYFQLLALLGGYDDENLETFRKAAQISGPSKFLVMPLYRNVYRICHRSKYHNKFKIECADALREAQELFLIKESNKVKEKTD